MGENSNAVKNFFESIPICSFAHFPFSLGVLFAFIMRLFIMPFLFAFFAVCTLRPLLPAACLASNGVVTCAYMFTLSMFELSMLCDS